MIALKTRTCLLWDMKRLYRKGYVLYMRIQFELDEDVVEKIDRYAKMQGLNRTTFIRACLGEKLMTYERVFGIVEKNVQSVCLTDDLRM